MTSIGENHTIANSEATLTAFNSEVEPQVFIIKREGFDFVSLRSHSGKIASTDKMGNIVMVSPSQKNKNSNFRLQMVRNLKSRKGIFEFPFLLLIFLGHFFRVLTPKF